MHRAQQLLFEDTMGPTDDLLSEGHMSNLAVQSMDGINCMVDNLEEGVAMLFE